MLAVNPQPPPPSEHLIRIALGAGTERDLCVALGRGVGSAPSCENTLSPLAHASSLSLESDEV